AKKRPKEVGDWVARARNHTPTISNPEELGKQWWIWWIDINPSWRGEHRPMIRKAGEPFKSMDFRGQNGFLNVLMVLKWWRNTKKDTSPDWEEAVGDVTWVLQEMQK
ncbi:hypothetical protein C8F04DRAFT_961203, partial [Mycena alexandri]